MENVSKVNDLLQAAFDNNNANGEAQTALSLYKVEAEKMNAAIEAAGGPHAAEAFKLSPAVLELQAQRNSLRSIGADDAEFSTNNF